MSNSNTVMMMCQESEDVDEIDEIGESIIEDRIDDDPIKHILEEEDYSDDFQEDLDYKYYYRLHAFTESMIEKLCPRH